tara:strand:+ start:1964 stop:4207 length:2244 start_codon:yes stop_codon:yes gene_type:complete
MSLEWETYKLYIFGAPNAEMKFQQNLREAEDQQANDPGLPGRIQDAARDGKQAKSLVKTLEQKMKLGESPEELRNWIAEACASQPGRVVKTVERTLDKNIQFRNRKRALRQKNQDFKISLPYTPIERGLHPQSLRALSPSKRWEVYIDETGNEFSLQAQSLDESDKNLGRIIALVMPEQTTLPLLGKSTHATELNHAEIEQLLKNLTQSNAGILGATLKTDLHSHSWIAAVSKLVRWILMMLPIAGPTLVSFKIENRGEYSDSDSLKALEDNLVDELRRLAPERFRDLNLSLQVIGKDDSYNGYVDVIANCWGSPDETKNRLLKRTGWPGYCLLQSTHLAEVDRLYHEAGRELEPETWFDICVYIAKEPGHSLFHDLLTQQGERTQCDRRLWQKYLSETRYRIAKKEFDAGSLGRALTWLEQYRPQSERLPGLLDLQMQSAQLAGANHLGHCDIEQVGRVMALANQLKDESAHDACEAALRIAISATNGFDFTSAEPFIESWLEQPIAVPGLLNYGKLLSTIGQLCAFRGEHHKALKYFDSALLQFDRLSDPAQSSSNRQQTNIYKAIVLLDMESSEAKGAVTKIIEQTTGKKGPASIRQLARSSSPLRFEHYLLLRWLVSHPEETQARQDYLDTIEDWQVHEGHPWMLINAYRGWLLADAYRHDAASIHLQQAADDCSDADDSTLLHWMAHCLYALGVSLELDVDKPARSYPMTPFPADRLVELHNAKSTDQRILALNTLLPFNFH